MPKKKTKSSRPPKPEPAAVTTTIGARFSKAELDQLRLGIARAKSESGIKVSQAAYLKHAALEHRHHRRTIARLRELARDSNTIGSIELEQILRLHGTES